MFSTLYSHHESSVFAMSNTSTFSILLTEAQNILTTSNDPLLSICNILKEQVAHYSWVGFYFMNDKTQTLEIGPYAGLKTQHTKIPYGKGICGQVASSAKMFVVDDVHEQDNYIACSLDTKAEIVAPVFFQDKLIGQIDIDSNVKKPFSKEDEDFLKALCNLIAEHPESFASHLPG